MTAASWRYCFRPRGQGTARDVPKSNYDYPRRSELLNTELAPDIAQIARALARKHRWRIIPEGPAAQHLLGLTEQVPAQYRYLSTGPNRTFQIMETSLCFIHRKTQHTAIDDDKAALIIQAIYSIGQGKLSDAQIEQLSKAFPPRDYPKIVRSTVSATTWVHDYIKQIAVQASNRRQDR